MLFRYLYRICGCFYLPLVFTFLFLALLDLRSDDPKKKEEKNDINNQLYHAQTPGVKRVLADPTGKITF